MTEKAWNFYPYTITGACLNVSAPCSLALARSGKHVYLKSRLFRSPMNCIMGAHVRVPLWEGVHVRNFACSPMTEWLMMFLSVHVRHPRCCRILSKSPHTSFIVHESSKAHFRPPNLQPAPPPSASSTPPLLHHPPRYRFSPGSASALRRDSRTTTAVTTM